MSITHCIFDLDGLLLDTESIYSECLQKLCSQYGKNFTVDVKLKMMGRSTLEAGRVLIRELNLPITEQDYVQQANALYREAFPTTKLLPGAERLIKHLTSHQIPIAIGTGSSREFFLMKTKEHQELFKLFDPIICSEPNEVRATKPAPDIFLECARKFPTSPNSMDKCLVFEDAENGIQAGVAAGMKVVFVPSLPLQVYNPDVIKQATVQLDSLVDFNPTDFGLPAFD